MNYLKRLGHVYKKHIVDKNEEPRFLVLTSFSSTFIIARLIVYGLINHALPKPFGYFMLGSTHIHHIVFGVILLLVAGFIRIPQVGQHLLRLSSIFYGVGAALTLDEFALLIHFNPNVYVGPQGRLSLDAVFIFLLLCMGFLWHGNFWRKVIRLTFSKGR